MAKKTKYGLGFSPLSMKYAKTYGFTEELLANKDVGMMGIATGEQKHILSHEYLVRTKTHLNNFVNRCIQDNTLGKLYKLTVSDTLAVLITDGETNLVADSSIAVNNTDTKIKGIRFNFDVDVIDPSTSALVHYKDITISIGMTLSIGSFSKAISIQNSLAYINTTAYAMDYAGLEQATGDVKVRIDSIVITPGQSFDYNTARIALYDILVCVISGQEKVPHTADSPQMIYDEDDGA